MWVVTGASGFVGGSILRELGSAAAALSLRDGILDDPDRLRAKLVGAEVVVHSASVVHRPKTPATEYVRFNVDGTRALLDAAKAAGVRRFVFLSSIKVHGETPAGPIDEHTPLAGMHPTPRRKPGPRSWFSAPRESPPSCCVCVRSTGAATKATSAR